MHKKKARFFWGAKERIYCYLKKKPEKRCFLHTPLPIPTGLVHPLTSKKQDNSSTKKEVVILSPSLLRATPSPRKLQEILSEGIHFFSWGKGSKVFCFGENGDTWMQFGMKPFTHVSRTYLRILLTGSNLYKFYPIRGILGGRRDLTKTATTDTKEPVVTTKYLEQSPV